MLDTHFDPKAAEDRLYAQWEASGAFKPRLEKGKPPFCIVIPPPNVTGRLHVGHALNNTLQDILVRFERMRGKAVLWQPGTDHAGITTQMVVERQLASEGNQNRRDLGREAFLKRVWEWKAQSGGMIVGQLKRLGASCDWSRERFTMDEGLSTAVRKVFVQLHKDGLIYRDKRLVNWDPHFQTAISDLEVENIEVKGHFWHFAYPLADGEGEIVVATTRPETMLGDVAVAVHPEDERYRHLIGKQVRLPIADRLIPIIADDYADPAQGSGAVKITPAHDFNDFKVGERHDLPRINIFDARAHLNDECPEAFRGMERYAARKKIVAAMEDMGLLRKVEPVRHTQPHGDRSQVVIEPWLTDQWYVDAKRLAEPALAAVEAGKTRFVPENWTRTYYDWLNRIEPWCVSRQLWWGHRIPAWYGPDNTVFVEETEAAALAAARAHYGAETALRQDEDVLDTWFSSALWPFSTMGWPDKTPELQAFYPTSVLVTAFDIIFFWVARMMMMGVYAMKEVPFRDVYVHALVRDEKGQKMAKSKGNVIDPIGLIDKFGADALRFTMAAMAAQGRDIRLSEARVEGHRNFGTKLWNAARFCQMNECVLWEDYDPSANRQVVNRWIVAETAKTIAAVTENLEAYKFNDAAGAIYRFVWNIFCDWYLELIKPLLNGEDEGLKVETRRTAAWTLDQILVLLHPFMPFITEDLWTKTAEFGPPRRGMLIAQSWPAQAPAWIDADAAAEIDWVIRLVTEIRAMRAELNVPAGARVPMHLVGAGKAACARLDRYRDFIERMGRLDCAIVADDAPPGAVQIVLDEARIALPIAGFVDLDVERARIEKEIAKADGDIAHVDSKLSNAGFIAKALPEIIEEHKERRLEAVALKQKLLDIAARLARV